MPASERPQHSTEIFASRLSALSKRRGTYSQVARDLGINRQQFARYLNGTSMPRDALLGKIADYFEVSTGSLFQTAEEAARTERFVRAPSSVFASLADVSAASEREEVQESDLPAGYYMYYRQSFLYPEKAVTQLAKVSRSDDGVTTIRRKFSVLLLKDLPGVKRGTASKGVFSKFYGSLMLFDVDKPMGDMMISAFKTATTFSKDVKPGLVLTHGRAGSLGPVAGRHVLERLPKSTSLLDAARQQGFRLLSELPEQVQYYMQRPDDLHPNIIGLRK